jgi:formylglycine-generating enzyme required for sulfatase activity
LAPGWNTALKLSAHFLAQSLFLSKTALVAITLCHQGAPPPGNLQFPVTEVSLNDAQSFAEWRSQRDHKKWRLPTEEEWEYAARNGAQDTFYPWGNQWLDGRANVDSKGLKPVGSYPQGAPHWGVLDLIGNVWEWTSTKAAAYPGDTIVNVPEGQFVMRGGGYTDHSSGGRAITATRRYFSFPSEKDKTVGFRLVRDEP